MVIGHIYLPYTKEGRYHPFLGDLFDIFLYPSKRIPYRGCAMSTESIIILFWGIVQYTNVYGICRIVYDIPYLRLLAYGKMS